MEGEGPDRVVEDLEGQEGLVDLEGGAAEPASQQGSGSSENIFRRELSS